jgi:hypothetical protein
VSAARLERPCRVRPCRLRGSAGRPGRWALRPGRVILNLLQGSAAFPRRGELSRQSSYAFRPPRVDHRHRAGDRRSNGLSTGSSPRAGVHTCSSAPREPDHTGECGPHHAQRTRLARPLRRVEREFGPLKHDYGLAPLRVRGAERVTLHADLTMLAARAGSTRARTVSLAA